MAALSIDLYLASSSPRRRELLAQLGLRPRLVAAETDETPAPAEPAEAYVTRIARAKARAGWATLSAPDHRPLLAADTAVVVEDQILGKPVDAENALQMLALLSGRWHSVLTAISVISVLNAAAGSDQPREPDSGALGGQTLREHQVLVRTEVRMRPITRHEALAYWASGEPRDKAGAYAVQGRGALFVESLCGSYSNVVGLPLFETAELLRAHGIDPLAGEPALAS